MTKLDELRKECESFFAGGYGNLPELAKLNVNAYMRGIKDGITLTLKIQCEDEPEQKEVQKETAIWQH